VQGSEFENTTGAIHRLYLATYQRLADRAGLNYWTRVLREGTPITTIATAFATAPEFVIRYGNLTNRGYVEQLYLNVLGRAGDAGGVGFWTGQLDNTVLSRGALLAAFSESPEFKARMRTDLWIAGSFIAMLNRAPTTVELGQWRPVVAGVGGGTTSTLTAALIASAEYAQRFPTD
jgi:Domain of unknown function (DUF4214)